MEPRSDLVEDGSYEHSLFALICGSTTVKNEAANADCDEAAKSFDDENSPTELAADVVCCAPCQMSRQCRALEGHPKTFSCAYCLMSLLLWPSMPVCVRVMVADKFDMDEWFCTSLVKGTLCLYCSMCQTNLELKRRGFPAGTSCAFVLSME